MSCERPTTGIKRHTAASDAQEVTAAFHPDNSEALITSVRPRLRGSAHGASGHLRTGDPCVIVLEARHVRGRFGLDPQPAASRRKVTAMTASGSSAHQAPRVRAWRSTAAGGIAIEVLALGVGGLWAVGVVLTGNAESVAVSLVLAAFALGLAALLALAARAVLGGRDRVRGPVITWQLLQAATAGTLIGGAGEGTPGAIRGAAWFAAVLAVVVVVSLVVDAARGTRPGAS